MEEPVETRSELEVLLEQLDELLTEGAVDAEDALEIAVVAGLAHRLGAPAAALVDAEAWRAAAGRDLLAEVWEELDVDALLVEAIDAAATNELPEEEVEEALYDVDEVIAAAVWAGRPGSTLDVCPLIAHPDYSRLGARYPGGLVVADAFFGLDNQLADGRMNATGVWACDPSTGLAGANPANEWIGFSVCVDIATPGDYLLGLGADNRTRFAVDGVLLREDPSDDVLNFQYWWVTPVQLTSGTHIVSFEGFNAGGPAGLGAEIAGPFPVGSLVDDAAMATADYAGNLVWTAADAVGSTFALGETNGWSCPDGMALDLCAAEPVCYAEDVVPCL